MEVIYTLMVGLTIVVAIILFFAIIVRFKDEEIQHYKLLAKTFEDAYDAKRIGAWESKELPKKSGHIHVVKSLDGKEDVVYYNAVSEPHTQTFFKYYTKWRAIN